MDLTNSFQGQRILSGDDIVLEDRNDAIETSTDDGNPMVSQVIMRSVSSDYGIQNKLGYGGYAVVMLANKKSSGIPYAIKMTQKEIGEIEAEDMGQVDAQRKQVAREFQILSTLDHDKVIKTFGFYEDKHNLSLVLEYMAGGDLYDRVQNLKTYSEKDARDAVFNVLQAIKYCHDKNVIHRDLKPENLLLERLDCNFYLKITDFGLAIFEDENGKASGYCGSDYYVSPDIIINKLTNGAHKYGKEVDMWSIGVITYVLLSGHPPFFGEHKEDMILKGLYFFDYNRWKNISIEAKTFISKLLKRNPTSRMTAAEALNDPWILRSDELLQANTLSNAQASLQKFNSLRKLKNSVKKLIAINRFCRKGVVVSGPTSFYLRYDIQQDLAFGLNAQVKLAFDKLTQRKVLLKIVPKITNLENNRFERAEEFAVREAKVMRVLTNHENILEFYDFYSEADEYILVQEYADGGRLLDQIVARESIYDEKEARNIIKSLISAVELCHANNIAHRDIRPENLLMQSVTGSNVLIFKLGEFGLAVEDIDGNMTGVVSNPLYMAPEMMLNNTYGLQVDMWSVGVIAYLLLSGVHPFNSVDQSCDEVLQKIEAGLQFGDGVSTLNWSNVSEHAKDFIQRLLIVDPLSRMTASQASVHPWLLVDAAALPDTSLSNSLEGISRVAATKRRFKVSACMVLSIIKMQKRLETQSSVDDSTFVNEQSSGTDIDDSSAIDEDGLVLVPVGDLRMMMDQELQAHVTLAGENENQGIESNDDELKVQHPIKKARFDK